MTQFRYDFYQRGPQPAMVMVHGFYKGKGLLPDGSLVPPMHLHAMPAASVPAHAPSALETPEPVRSVAPASVASTMTDAERAVIEAAEEQERMGMLPASGLGDGVADYTVACVQTCRAVRAFRKSREPVDPVAEVKAVWTDLRDRGYTVDWTQRMDAAIAALEVKP